LYVCIIAFPYGKVFSSYLTKKTTIFTVLCRHAQFDWQITQAILFMIGKYNIMLTLTYVIVVEI